MQTLRNLSILLMVAITLPWGAFVAAHRAHVASLVITHDQLHAVVKSSLPLDVQQAAPQQTKLVAPKRCRTASLPGYSCVPDPVIHAVKATALGTDPVLLALSEADWRADSLTVAPPSDPPRWF